ncbi:hypothetical protein L3Y34_009453 [Caenorhabditis briggsae]|uniref:DUF38 domain-containing protein n=1 Tax=Caenorhabditis briggsae TaxID=6238 RepID=A0AAE9AA90_CAEBR|nr:hypothetical protein L3Y34_009453 [Caenorhabditis briggsae]
MDGSEASVGVPEDTKSENLLNKTRPRNISQLDDLVKEILFMHTDWRSMLAMRNTCDSFRRFIDEKQPIFDLSEVEIDLRDTHVQIVCKTHSKEINQVQFMKHENGCLVTERERISLLENANFLDTFFQGFKFILMQNFALQKLKIGYRSYSPDHEVAKFLNELETILKARKTKLKVNCLSLKTKKKEYHRIMSLVAPASLKRIELNFLDVENVELRILEQWKSAEELISNGFFTRQIYRILKKNRDDNGVVHRQSPGRPRTTSRNMDRNILRACREDPRRTSTDIQLSVTSPNEPAYLNAPNFQKAFIRYENSRRLTDMDVLAGNVRPTRDSQHWFRTPYSPNRCLFVFVSERVARFVNAPISSAPEGAFDTNQEFPEPPLPHWRPF